MKETTKVILDTVAANVHTLWPDHGFVFVLVEPGETKQVYVRTNMTEGVPRLMIETAEEIKRVEGK